jgi:hypothetical protein
MFDFGEFYLLVHYSIFAHFWPKKMIYKGGEIDKPVLRVHKNRYGNVY